jgi:RNA recognition motif-containing protein
MVVSGDMGNIHKEITISNRIHLNGFSQETTVEDLEREFRKHGDIIDSIIIEDRATGQSKGYGFITFDSQNKCEKVLAEVKSVIINGCEVTVQPAKIRRRPPKSHLNYGPRYHRVNDVLGDYQGRCVFTTVGVDGLVYFHHPLPMGGPMYPGTGEAGVPIDDGYYPDTLGDQSAMIPKSGKLPEMMEKVSLYDSGDSPKKLTTTPPVMSVKASECSRNNYDAQVKSVTMSGGCIPHSPPAPPLMTTPHHQLVPVSGHLPMEGMPMMPMMPMMVYGPHVIPPSEHYLPVQNALCPGGNVHYELSPPPSVDMNYNMKPRLNHLTPPPSPTTSSVSSPQQQQVSGNKMGGRNAVPPPTTTSKNSSFACRPYEWAWTGPGKVGRYLVNNGSNAPLGMAR